MSDNPSLRNSKRLYDLSRWDTGKSWNIIREQSPELYVPAYDAGYLLRKLPPNTDITKVEGGRTYYSAHHQQFDTRADTPEDALCLLAVQLFEQGILKREEA